jgi:hypothetical protein
MALVINFVICCPVCVLVYSKWWDVLPVVLCHVYFLRTIISVVERYVVHEMVESVTFDTR